MAEVHGPVGEIEYSIPTEPGELAVFILNEMRSTGSWDLPTLDRAIESISWALGPRDNTRAGAEPATSQADHDGEALGRTGDSISPTGAKRQSELVSPASENGTVGGVQRD